MRKDGKLVIKLNKYFFLNLSIFIITLSGSLFIVNMEMQNALEFLGYEGNTNLARMIVSTNWIP